MAWKRGVQNNRAGEIRAGQIREFRLPSSKESGATTKLQIINIEGLEDTSLSATYSGRHRVSCYLHFVSLLIDPTPMVIELPIALFSSSDERFAAQTLYLHSHEHPLCVVMAVRNPCIPLNCIALNEAQRVNSKVCTGEVEDWTIYQGETFVFDSREGVVADTEIRFSKKPLPTLRRLEFDVVSFNLTTLSMQQ